MLEKRQKDKKKKQKENQKVDDVKVTSDWVKRHLDVHEHVLERMHTCGECEKERKRKEERRCSKITR